MTPNCNYLDLKLLFHFLHLFAFPNLQLCFCLKLSPTIKDRLESCVDRCTEGGMPVSVFYLSESSG